MNWDVRASERQNALLKPPGSLGRLEELAIRLADLQRTDTPQARGAACLLFAADHPVTVHGVSPYPSAVTASMVEMFCRGKAASTVMARTLGIPVTVFDVGVDTPYVAPQCAPGVRHVRIESPELRAAGDLRHGQAMSQETYHVALEAGRMAVRALPEDTRVLLLGEMGIGNTTAAAALAGALCSLSAEQITGRGTGAPDAMLAVKQAVVADALATVRDAAPTEVLRRVSGREISALVGAIQEAEQRRLAVLVDGFIVGAAALGAVALGVDARVLLFSHRSHEQGHTRILAHLGVEPLLNLSLRLGEATGALTAFPLLELACAVHNEMGTLAELGLGP
jgi:nicotinate-nucleotide--dimethylbenzimidazole phosphoribosyltransferase